MNVGRFLFLGTGGSSGVPQIGCCCVVCRSGDVHNKRLRSSGLLTIGSDRVLIDAGPDLREQALHYGIPDLGAVLLTHFHADHVAGMDDLRPYYFLHHQKILCVLSEHTYAEVKRRYHYLLDAFDFQVLPADQGLYPIAGVEMRYFSYYQGRVQVTGFRVGNLAYLTDIRSYSDSIWASLQEVEVLILSAPRHTANHAHWGLDEAVGFSRRVAPQVTYITHITHDLEHHALTQELPEGVHLAYDGLEIAFTYSLK